MAATIPSPICVAFKEDFVDCSSEVTPSSCTADIPEAVGEEEIGLEPIATVGEATAEEEALADVVFPVLTVTPFPPHEPKSDWHPVPQ